MPKAVVQCILSEFSYPQGPCYQIPKLLPLLRQLFSQLLKKETVRKSLTLRKFWYSALHANKKIAGVKQFR